jgi:hypothetical protein
MISSLTIDANNLSSNSNNVALWVWNCQGCIMVGNTILGNINGSVPAVEFIGGGNNSIVGNSIVGSPSGGAQLQINPLGTTLNSQFTISQNTFDSSNLLVIGLDNVQVTNNYFSNKTLGNMIAIFYCGGWNYAVSGYLIDGNTIDATFGGMNGSVISAVPNDPGGLSIINDVTISNNVIIATGASISVQNFDEWCLLNCQAVGEKYNTVIKGNILISAWFGSMLNLAGGTTGIVDRVWVDGNTLIGSGGTPNAIYQDAQTYNVTIGVNSGL